MCPAFDAIRVLVRDGQPVRIEGEPNDPRSLGHICAKGNSGIWLHYDPYRVKAPLKRTGPKGMYELGKWVEISWDEAYNTIASKISQVRAKGEDGIVMYSSYSALPYSQTWASFTSAAIGTNENIHLGMNWCGHTAHYLSRVAHLGFTSVVDYDLCNYLIQPGRTHGMEGGATFVPRANKVANAHARGMKIVNFDPRMGAAGAKADEWWPVLPGTDGAVASAMLEVLLVELQKYDVDFIKKNTNGPYLVGPDGLYVRDPSNKKPLVWDSVDKVAKTYDDKSVKDFAILGSFNVNGVDCKPAFQLLKDAVTPMSPEWAEGVSGVPAQVIRRIATEFVNAAQIGSTITIDGKTLPFRPAAVEYYGGNASNHLHGVANGMSWELLNTVVGNQDAPGGHCNDTIWPWLRGGPDGMIEHPAASYTLVKSPPYKFVFPPQSPELEEFFPLGDHLGAVAYVTMSDPTNYWGAGNKKIEFMMLHATNPVLSMYDPPKMERIWKDAEFIAYFCLTIDESAEGFADIILPDRCYLEEYQILNDWLMQPVASPPANIPFLHDALSEIASRAGFLKDYNTALNASLVDPYKVDVNSKVPTEDLFDRLLKSKYGAEKGLTWFKANGGVKTAQKFTYQPWKFMLNPPRRLPVYVEMHVEVAKELKKNMDANGVKWDFSDYSPVPTWIPSHLHVDTPPYDLIAMAYLQSYHTYTWTNQVPTLAEISLEDPYASYVMINTKTAEARGIKDGDLIWVESEIGKAKGRARLTEAIHPRVVAIHRSMAGWARNSIVKDLYRMNAGIAYQTLRPTKMEYIDKLTATLENCIKVKVYKAEGS